MGVDLSQIDITQMIRDRVDNIIDKEFPILSFGFETILEVDERFYRIDIKVSLET